MWTNAEIHYATNLCLKNLLERLAKDTPVATGEPVRLQVTLEGNEVEICATCTTSEGKSTRKGRAKSFTLAMEEIIRSDWTKES
jgi:hypothetical protein